VQFKRMATNNNVSHNAKMIGGNQIKNSSLIDQQDQADQE